MRAPKWPFLMIAALAVALVAVLISRQQKLADLRREVTLREQQRAEKERLQEKNARLLAAQPTDQQLEAMASDLVLADQLRSQLAVMQRRVADMGVAQPKAAPKPVILSLVGTSVAANFWQDAGRDTPEAAFQTALWAAANGELDALAASLAFDAETRLHAGAAFARLPAVLQKELGTPERMIALLTAVDVPLGRASIVGQRTIEGSPMIAAQLVTPDGESSRSVFSFQSDGGQWRLKVPPGVVKKYSTALGGK